MKHFAPRLGVAFVLATLMAVCSNASASCTYMNGYVPSNIQLDLGGGVHMVPRDAPVGTVLYEVRKKFPDGEYYATCTPLTQTARHWDLPTTPLPLVGGNTYQTGVQGIGVKVSSLGNPFPRSSQPLSDSITVDYWWGTTDLVYSFVKTGPISGGTVNGASLPRVRYSLDNHALLIYDAAAVGTTTFVTGACGTPDVEVNMETQKTSAFTGIGTRVGMRDFDIALNQCPPGLKSITYSLNAVNGVVDATNAVARLGGSSTATGVGVQITDRSNNPITFGSARTAAAYRPAEGGNISIPLRAWYYQTGAQVAAGRADAYVEFTMSYQ